jgi:hypothetical protein
MIASPGEGVALYFEAEAQGRDLALAARLNPVLAAAPAARVFYCVMG